MKNIGVIIFLALAVISFSPGDARPLSLPSDPINTLDSFIGESGYFNEDGLIQIDYFDFEGIWAYTAIAFEAGVKNGIKEKVDCCWTVTYTTNDLSNWGSLRHFNFNGVDNLYFKKFSWWGFTERLDPYTFNDTHPWKNDLKLYELSEYSELLGYLTNSIELPPGTILVGFEDRNDMDFDDMIIAMFEDNDMDWAGDAVDNCLGLYNPDQLNTDKANEGTPGFPEGDKLGDACDPDDDNDGLPDAWEIQYSSGPDNPDLDPLNPDSDGNGTLDGDEDFDPEGLLNRDERAAGTDPHLIDTDFDNWSDKHEIQAGTDPLGTSIEEKEELNSLFIVNGIWVDPVNGNDYNLGTIIGDETYALKTLHAAVERLNMLDDGDYVIHIAGGIYSTPNGEYDGLLEIKNGVTIQSSDGQPVIIDGQDAVVWRTAILVSAPVNVTLIDISIRHFDVGFGVQSEMPGVQLNLGTSSIQDCITGIDIISGSNSSISGGTIARTYGGNNTGTYGIVINVPGSIAINNLAIQNCETGVEVTGGATVAIYDCLFFGELFNGNPVTGSCGILLTNVESAMSLEEAFIEDFDIGVGITTDSVQLEFVGGNVSGCKAAAIDISGSGNTISGGIITNNLGTGVKIIGQNNVVQNLVDDNDNVIQTLAINNNAGIGIAVTGGSNTIQDVDVSFNGDDGIKIVGDENSVQGSIGVDPPTMTVSRNAGDGVGITGSYNTISYAKINNNDLNGVRINGDNNVIEETEVSANAINGILVEGGTGSNKVLNTNISGNLGDGVVILSGTHNQVNGSDVNGSSTGVYIAAGSSDNTIDNTKIHSNYMENLKVNGDSNNFNNLTIEAANGKNGIGYFSGSDNQIISGLISGDNSPGTIGLNIQNIAGGTIINSVTIENFDIGVGFAVDGVNLPLSGATIEACNTGIDTSGKAHLKIDLGGSAIEDCSIGIKFSGGYANLVCNGNVYNSLLEGIRFEGCSNVIAENAVSSINVVNTSGDAETGILFKAGIGNQASNCVVAGFDTGVVIATDSADTLVQGGSISGNLLANILVEGQDSAINAVSFDELGIGTLFGSGNQILNVTIDTDPNDTGANAGTGLILGQGAGQTALKKVVLKNFLTGIDIDTDAACLSLLDSSQINGCDIGIDVTENYMLNIDLSNTRLLNNTTALRFAAGSSNNSVTGGLFGEDGNGNTNGIVFEDCGIESPDDNLIQDAILSHNLNGVVFRAGTNNGLKGCFLMHNENGALFSGGLENWLEGCEITGNETGAAMLGGMQNALRGCTVTYNGVGVEISPQSNGNLVSGGIVQNNSKDNIRIDGHNNTIENITLDQSLGLITGSNNELANLSILGDGTGYGLIVHDGELILRNVTVGNFKFGFGFAMDAACLKLQGTSTITGCADCEAGILIADKTMLDIDLGDAVISGFNTGIKFCEGSINNVVRNGTVQGNRADGILFEGGEGTPQENRIIGTLVTLNGRNGVALMDGFDNQVESCTISANNIGLTSGGYGGIAILNGSGLVRQSRIYDNGCTGIYLDEVSDVKILSNLIYSTTGVPEPDGVWVGFSNDVVIASNTITQNNYGIVIEDGALPQVEYNILYGNTNEDIFLEGNYAPEKLKYNDIGNVNKIDLPFTNISVDPDFNNDPNANGYDSEKDPYSLRPSSLCIDRTDIEGPGEDIDGLSRPKGSYWDMGAFESTTFLDEDDDGLPDTWELAIVNAKSDDEIESIYDVNREDDFDLDGVNNYQEYLNGSDPIDPVHVGFTVPETKIAYTANASYPVTIYAATASSLTIEVNGVVQVDNEPISTPFTNTYFLTLAAGQNFVSATVSGNEGSASDTLTVILDSQAPTVAIISPTPQSEFVTSIQSIVLSGNAADDTGISQSVPINWTRLVEGYPDATGVASGSTNWTTSAIPLESGDGVVNVITITAEDIFGHPGTATINVIVSQVAQEAGVDYVEGDDSSGGAQVEEETDPQDLDGDGYTNEDEIACGTDPFDPNSIPDNLNNIAYPTGSDKDGYLWPNCLRTDIDEDGLPNWWETDVAGLDPEDPNTPFDEHDPQLNDGDDDLDGDGFTNRQEYENGTDPNVPQTEAFALEVINITGGVAYNEWLPQFGHALEVRATWIGDGTAPANAVFKLKMTTNYPGRAVNDPEPDQTQITGYPTWYYDANQNIDNYHGPDFGLTADPLASIDDCGSRDCFNQGAIVVPESSVGSGEYVIHALCWDYGGSAKVLVADDDTGNDLGQLWLPQGASQNGIGSAWQYDVDAEGAVINANAIDPAAFNPSADIDAINFANPNNSSAPLGDDFNNLEEYRGILFASSIPGSFGTLQHLRLNPLRKDLFIRHVGFVENGYLFEVGPAYAEAHINLHDTTMWGHDATADGAFFIYYDQGTVSVDSQTPRIITGVTTSWSTAWPRHEWELKLDSGDEWIPIGYWESPEKLWLNWASDIIESATTYRIRKPLPHINVLIIRNKIEETDSYIQFVSALPPDPGNPLGTRYWRWVSKGFAWTNLPADRSSMYGYAVALEDPLYHYFNDGPYLDSTTWSGADFDPNANDLLDPLSLVEDQTDQLSPIDGVLGDGPDGIWDGDRRQPSTDDWEDVGTLNPFDIDNDGLVELPTMSDPTDPNLDQNEYSINTVRKHTVTHEIGHALGGPGHTNVPTCLMYKYTTNWNRDGYLSDDFKSRIRIHNITR